MNICLCFVYETTSLSELGLCVQRKNENKTIRKKNEKKAKKAKKAQKAKKAKKFRESSPENQIILLSSAIIYSLMRKGFVQRW